MHRASVSIRNSAAELHVRCVNSVRHCKIGNFRMRTNCENEGSRCSVGQRTRLSGGRGCANCSGPAVGNCFRNVLFVMTARSFGSSPLRPARRAASVRTIRERGLSRRRSVEFVEDRFQTHSDDVDIVAT